MSAAENNYRNELQKWLGTDARISFFWKGRVALYAILKAAGVGKDDEVILPAFTCMVVPNVIIYLGAKPVYVDIDSGTFNIDETKIESKISSKTKVILAQNTFGQSANLNAIMSIAAKHKLLVVEDCAHGFGGSYDGKPNGTIAHAAFFSTQWSKPYSTGLGGIAVTRDNELGKKISSLSENAINPSLKERFILKALLTAHNILLNPFTYSLLVRIYRTLSRMKLVVASSENTELEGTDLPKGFLKKMSRTQMTKGVAALRNLKKNIEHRKMVAAQYSQIISELGGTACFKSDSAEHTFLRYSILVEDKEKFMLQAEKLKLEVGDWFVSPLHPVMSSWEKWFYSEGSCPVAENICKQIINLPTHEKINEKYISRIQQLLALQKIY